MKWLAMRFNSAVMTRMYFGPPGDLDAAQLFHGHTVPVVEDHAGKIVHPGRVGQELFIGPVFGHFFMTPMGVADDRFPI